MTADWKEITEDHAWFLCERDGIPAPYAGYLAKLRDGSAVRCIRQSGKTVWEFTSQFKPGASELLNPFPKGRWT